MRLSTNKIFYVYEWFNTETGIPFYVGKGKNDRYKECKRRNSSFIEYYNDHNCDARIIYKGLDEAEAFQKEYELTKYYFDMGIQLTNQRLGNKGGYTHTEESLKKISEASRRCWSNPKYRAHICEILRKPKSAEAQKNIARAQQRFEVKLKQRNAHLGQIPYNKGMKMSKEYCDIMKKALNRPETQTKMSKNNNSNKPLLVIDTLLNIKYSYYNIADFIRTQDYIPNNYKDKRNLWRAIKQHKYTYLEGRYIFKI